MSTELDGLELVLIRLLRKPHDLETDRRGEGFNRTVSNGTDPRNGSNNEDNDRTISTANDSGISPQGQQSVVLNDALAFDADVDLFRLKLEQAKVLLTIY